MQTSSKGFEIGDEEQEERSKKSIESGMDGGQMGNSSFQIFIVCGLSSASVLESRL
jgi:hypothetical protein